MHITESQLEDLALMATALKLCANRRVPDFGTKAHCLLQNLHFRFHKMLHLP